MNHLRVAFAPYWQSIQHALFPQLERVLGPLTEKQQQLVQTLEVIRIEQMIPRRFRVPGRPPKDRAAMARALVAKAVYDMPTTRVLLDRLDTDVVLRRICGWERRSEVPSESVFSRAFAEFSDTQLPQRVHEALIWNTHRDRLVGHLSRDSTAIEAREKPAAKEKARLESDVSLHVRRARTHRRPARTPGDITSAPPATPLGARPASVTHRCSDARSATRRNSPTSTSRRAAGPPEPASSRRSRANGCLPGELRTAPSRQPQEFRKRL